MLTEGWDANNVTHVLGVRAFGTQLLCEQVIGRALRRQSYELNEQGRLMWSTLMFLESPSTLPQNLPSPSQQARETVQVKAVRPERDHLEIKFPRVLSIGQTCRGKIGAKFDHTSTLTLTDT